MSRWHLRQGKKKAKSEGTFIELQVKGDESYSTTPLTSNSLWPNRKKFHEIEEKGVGGDRTKEQIKKVVTPPPSPAESGYKTRPIPISSSLGTSREKAEEVTPWEKRNKRYESDDGD
ncbi:hypothetical protein CEXT_159831 [Caerostris extrusa]|uniref:Uncharacterized protein n=1 Tax=Caerostris extrusa TaxID=172846 RepID=A0AAV4TU83_CAEEX|nr:hypothetical protein CEXT_159831 [Caerostris extrusa]